MKQFLAYIGALLRLNLKILTEKPKTTLVFACAMFLQDMFLFAAWIVFFGALGRVRGWGMAEIFLLYGIMFLSYGSAAVFIGGIRHLGLKIISGEIELYMTQPTHLLPQLFITRCNPGGIGDMIAGVLFLAGFSGLHVKGFLIALMASFLVMILFETMKLIFYSLEFFVRGGSRFGDYLTDTLFYLTTVPEQGQAIAVKAVLFSVMPAGLMVILPIHLIRTGDLSLLAAMAGIVAAYGAFGLWFFHYGVRRYKRQGAT